MTAPTSTTVVGPAPTVPDVVFEHLEETAFLFVQRRRMLFSPDAPRRALERLDSRLEAHADGLAIAGATAARLAEEQLEAGDPWLAAAAAWAWLELAEPPVATVRERLAAAAGTHGPSWREALRRASDPVLERLFPAAETLAEPAAWETATDARGWRGALAPRTLAAAARSEHAGVRRAAARHARDPETLRTLLEDPEPGVRERALWSMSLASPAGAAALARRFAGADPPLPVALRVLGLFGERSDGERIASLVAHPLAAPAAITALRDLAVPECARALLPLLDSPDEDAAAAALEAFESLLGPVPAPDEAHPLPAGTGPAEAHWQRAGAGAGKTARRLRGVDLAWPGPADDEPMERLWRGAIARPAPETTWLRREVPDGFFDGAPPAEVRPGV